MKSTLISIASLFLLASCSSSGLLVPSAVKKQTVAQGAVYRDVTSIMTMTEAAWGKGCETSKVIKIVDKDHKEANNPKVTALEHWHLDRCGKPVVYAVSYYSDPNGGTTISLRKIKG